MQSLLTKYRPGCLDEVLGQPAVVRALKQFVAKPYPAAMLFHGESGTGKTSAAAALAHDLGVSVQDGPIGGWVEIASGELTVDTVRRELAQMRLRPMFGSGRRVLAANEVDRQMLPVETVWLDALEHLPSSTVVVFTTNMPEKLSKRFKDRCEVYGFECDRKKLQPAIKRLAQRIWSAEVGKGKPPALDTLGMPTLLGPDSFHASFRLALQQLAKFIREAQQANGDGDFAAVQRQIEVDLRSARPVEAVCDHCEHQQPVPYAAPQHTCEKCGGSLPSSGSSPSLLAHGCAIFPEPLNACIAGSRQDC